METFVTDHHPDLVVIGGISHREDTDAIRQVVEQIRARSRAEILLLSGPFGNVDPIRQKNWTPVADPRADTFRSRLARLAAETEVEFMDLKGAWGKYLRMPIERIADEEDFTEEDWGRDERPAPDTIDI